MVSDSTSSYFDGGFHHIDWGGQGPEARIVHATGFCARIYSPLAERLRPHLHVTGMDDRGHGQTREPADPERLTDWKIFVDDSERSLDRTGEARILVGHSRGGVMSVMLAVRRPDLVRALVLIDPTILPFSWMWWWYLAKKTGLSRKVPIAARAAGRRDGWPNREAVRGYFIDKRPFASWTPGFLDGYFEDGFWEAADGTVQLACSPAWESRAFTSCSHDIWRYVPRITQPTLVLYGKDSDTFLPVAARRFARVLPDASMIGLDGTDHFVVMQKPDDSTDIILGFLRERGILGPGA